MGQAYLVRRGGAGGKPKVIACADAASLPEKAKVNTIAVITDVAVKDLYIQSAAPEAPEVGAVWAVIGVGSTPRIEVFDGELWRLVDAYLFDGASWVQMTAGRLDLYLNGTDYTINSGGWGSKEADHGTVSWTNTYLALSYWSDDKLYASVYTKAAIDLTLFSKLVIVGRVTERYSSDAKYHVAAGVVTSPYTGTVLATGEATMKAIKKITSVSSTLVTYEVDLNGLVGAHYIQIMQAGYKFRMTEAYLTV